MHRPRKTGYGDQVAHRCGRVEGLLGFEGSAVHEIAPNLCVNFVTSTAENGQKKIPDSELFFALFSAVGESPLKLSTSPSFINRSISKTLIRSFLLWVE
jgi:hypothetical protein